MPDDELLGIGAFALLSGLTVTALRHYDEVGLLPPAQVDDWTRYRYYRRSQLADAHLVRTLREVGLPLDRIREALGGGDVAALLGQHKDDLAERLARLDNLIAKGVTVPTATASRLVLVNIPVDDLEHSRTFYERLLGVEFCEEQHADGPRHLNATFGEWDTPSWFLVTLWPEAGRAADLGFLVDDLDAADAAAIADGATTVWAPKDADGMPRNARITDPSGNFVGLYQA